MKNKILVMMAFCPIQSLLCMHPDWDLNRRYDKLISAVLGQDYVITMECLQDGIHPNPPHGRVSPLEYAFSKPLAQLLIANGAHIPANILHDERCQSDIYSSDLLAFYLEKGFKMRATRLRNNIRLDYAMEVLLHELSKFPLGCGDRAQESKPESTKYLKNRLEKAQIILKFGANPYRLMTFTSHGRSAFHVAASKEDLYMCRLLIEHEIIRKPAFITFLACCKHNFPRFYDQKDILTLLWNSLAPSRLLTLKDRDGKTMRDLGSDLFKSVLKQVITSPFNLESALADLEECEQPTRETHE